MAGSDDTTALVWDLTGHALQKEPRAAPLADKELEGIWTDLASEDAAKAYRALGLLVRSGQHAVPFLERRLRPPQAGDPKQIARLIADLDSDRFDVREKAAQELEKLGDAAEPALRKAMLDQPPAETRRRVEQLLEGAARSPERLRTLRALEALEQIDTPEARRVLQALARGLSEAKLTQEAKAAVERVSKRTASKP